MPAPKIETAASFAGISANKKNRKLPVGPFYLSLILLLLLAVVVVLLLLQNCRTETTLFPFLFPSPSFICFSILFPVLSYRPSGASAARPACVLCLLAALAEVDPPGGLCLLQADPYHSRIRQRLGSI